MFLVAAELRNKTADEIPKVFEIHLAAEIALRRGIENPGADSAAKSRFSSCCLVQTTVENDTAPAGFPSTVIDRLTGSGAFARLDPQSKTSLINLSLLWKLCPHD
jgi:hypothetical protein